ncbi:MAG: hypothetical protein CMQ14_01635 [Gammaproteobacteria bacterium]|nr:hypothetical protein [Gammaproteobacteria bacterium]
MSSTNWQQWDIRLLTVLASLALSGFAVAFASIPNDDAYTYIRTAEIFLEHGVGAAISHYTWAGYPILIALVSLLGLSLFTSAYVLNAIFFAILAYAFISILRHLDDSNRIAWLAALTVLAYPELNEYRDMVLRDVGFWAMLLLALWRFMVFVDTRQFSHSVFFVLAMIGAMLFRAEAVIYLVAIPFALFLQSDRNTQQNRLDFLKLAGFICSVGALGFLMLLAAGINLFSLIFELLRIYQPFLISRFNPDEAITAAQATAIFGEYAGIFSRDYVSAIVAVGLSVVLVMTLFYTIGGPFFWLLAFGLVRKHIRWHRAKVAPILAVSLTNLFILVVFLYTTKFLTGRYALVFGLMAATLVPFLISSIIERNRGGKWEKFVSYFLILFFFYCLIDSYVSFGKSKDWLLDAAGYVELQAESDTQVLTNNHTIAYFSRQVENYDDIIREIAAQNILDAAPGTIVALEMYFEMSLLVEQESVKSSLQLLQQFPNAGKPKMSIYRRVD